MAGPLEGIKVVDLTRMAPGPFCTMVLGDLGADVVMVEEPGGGRMARESRSGAAEFKGDERLRAAFNALRRNKRSIVLDLKSSGGRDVLQRLCRDADVFVEGFRPGVVDRLGCGYQALAETNPRLVYCSISGYGQEGPYRALVGHDINYIATAGALGIMGSEEGGPAIPYNILADYAGGGMHAVVGILAALMGRHVTGRGQYADISMTDGVAYMLAAAFSEYGRTGAVPRPGAMALNGGAPYYNVYRCRDGKYISIGCIEPWFWANLCKALGREDLTPLQHDVERRPEVFAALREVFMARTRDEWFELLSHSGDVAVGKVNDLAEALDDPQIKDRGMVREVGVIDGKTVSQVGVAPKLSETPGEIRRLGPTLGQDSDEVLRELGYGSDEIDALRTAGALG